jgi:hypothetical protein
MPAGAAETTLVSTLDQVLSPAFLGHLGRMRLGVRHAFGARPGDTPVRGLVQPTGLEVERHKPYDQGDELRYLDWNAYARLDQLLVRQFRAEREAPVHIFVDGSASMAAPVEDGKFEFAVGLALSLAYVAVRHHNPVRMVLVQENESDEKSASSRATPRSGPGYITSPWVRVPAMLQILADFCRGLRAGGATALERGVGAYSQSHAVPGLAILISDFLVEPGIARALLHHFAGHGYEVAALRPLGAGERDPSRLFQKARIRDAESGREKVVRLSAENLALYQRALAAHLDGLARDCGENEALVAVCDVDAGLDHCLFTQLPQVGLLR